MNRKENILYFVIMAIIAIASIKLSIWFTNAYIDKRIEKKLEDYHFEIIEVIDDNE